MDAAGILPGSSRHDSRGFARPSSQPAGSKIQPLTWPNRFYYSLYCLKVLAPCLKTLDMLICDYLRYLLDAAP